MRRYARAMRTWMRRRSGEPALPALPDDLREGSFAEIYRATAPYTMTSPERMYALYEASRYIGRAGIPGAVVECGVWKGGSIMLAASTLLADGDTRDLWLYDTFEGMPPAGTADFARQLGQHADEVLAREDALGADARAVAGLDEVRANMARTRYPGERVHYVQGKVEETIPREVPEQIALLRLDTDWYESTRHELEQLYPRLAPGGVLIIDDYGWWDGARKAVDEFFSASPVLLNRIDGTGGRIAVKP